MLVWGTKRPESNGTTAELREPALELGLSRVMGKATHV